MVQITDDQWTIACHTGHNASIVVAKGRKILEVIEFERFVSYKNAGYMHLSLPAKNVDTWRWEKPYIDEDRFLVQSKLIKDYISRKYTESFDYGLIQGIFLDENNKIAIHNFECISRFKSLFNVREWAPLCSHHKSHAANAFYQSPYDKALCISADGIGNDGSFNLYLNEREKETVFLTSVKRRFLGILYAFFAYYCDDITTHTDSKASEDLEYAGKIMGLSSYGKVREEWLPHFIKFYKSHDIHQTPFNTVINTFDEFQIYNENQQRRLFSDLSDKIGVEFNIINKLTGQLQHDVVATSQRAFEEVFIETIMPHLNNYSDLPVCFSGGCALNIILNTRLVEELGREVFVGPSPNDSGQALGMMLDYLKPKEPFDATYSGVPILDIDSLSFYLHSDKIHNINLLNITDLATKIAAGKIFGIVRGRSENGPRALGNRSILCNPAIPEMKDILNYKVKKREPYRPFAPVVRLEDVNKYFHWEKESRWMSFCPRVREEYASKLPSITHVDGTARVQTVTKEQNEFLYNLLTEIEKITGMGVLLNTSFNIAGKPLVSTARDALWMLDNTGLDGLVIEDIQIEK
jgi:carbamoyltransferase